MIKGHMELKCHSLLFRRASRAVNVKNCILPKKTDSFIHPLWHFHRHRRPMWQLRKDQGTNFIEECRELKEALQEMNHTHMRIEPLKQECQWINLKWTHQDQATWVAFGNNSWDQCMPSYFQSFQATPWYLTTSPWGHLHVRRTQESIVTGLRLTNSQIQIHQNRSCQIVCWPWSQGYYCLPVLWEHVFLICMGIFSE